MFLLIVGTPGCGVDRVRSFLSTTYPQMLDLTPGDERVRLPGGMVDPMTVFVELLNAHCAVAREKLLARYRSRDLLLAYSMWEHEEVGYDTLSDARDRAFFAESYASFRDSFPAPDAVIDLRTDFPKAVTLAGLRGLSLTHAEFDARLMRLEQFVARLQVPVETVENEAAEIDPLLEEVRGLVDSFRDTFNGPRTIWQTRLFRSGE